MVFTKILNIAASLYYFTTNNYNGNSFRKNKVSVIPSYQPPIKLTEYIPLSDDSILFISYPNNIRKDVRYKNGKYEEVNIKN